MTTLVAFIALVSAQDVKIGKTAPDFALHDQDGTIRKLADYKGKTVVLLFFPKDFTPG